MPLQQINKDLKVKLDGMSQTLKLPKVRILDITMNNQPTIIQQRYESIPRSRDKKLIIIYRSEYLVRR